MLAISRLMRRACEPLKKSRPTMYFFRARLPRVRRQMAAYTSERRPLTSCFMPPKSPTLVYGESWMSLYSKRTSSFCIRRRRICNTQTRRLGPKSADEMHGARARCGGIGRQPAWLSPWWIRRGRAGSRGEGRKNRCTYVSNVERVTCSSLSSVVVASARPNAKERKKPDLLLFNGSVIDFPGSN